MGDYIAITHDRNLSVLLSETRDAAPSVLQVRTQDITPEAIGSLVISAVREYEAALNHGAIATIQVDTSWVQVLPIRKRD